MEDIFFFFFSRIIHKTRAEEWIGRNAALNNMKQTKKSLNCPNNSWYVNDSFENDRLPIKRNQLLIDCLNEIKDSYLIILRL